MTTIILFITSALSAYLIAGVNPAIIVSRLGYHKDIRTCGSGNPGFTNFKRVFGNRWAWWVLLLDLAKAAVVVGIFASLFDRFLGNFQFGAAYTGMFCMLGHAFPVWYKFKGGKGFLVYMSTIFLVDWRAGLVATAVLVVFLLTTKYMSLSTMLAVTSSVIYLLIAGASTPWVTVLCAVQVLFIIFRHAENIKRLIAHTETKFSFGGSKATKNQAKR